MTQGQTELTTPAEDEAGRSALDRMLNPRSVAVVGVSETSMFAAPVRRSLEADAEFFFVHPKATSIFGQEVYPDLRAHGRPVVALYSEG